MATTTVDLRQSYRAMLDELRSELVQRDAEIDALGVCVLSRDHLFMLGEPGLAKTLLMEQAAKRLGASTFSVTGYRTLGVEDVFGPRSIRAFKDGRWERELDGFAATTELILFDEIWEMGSSMLIALLKLLNERRVKQGAIEVPAALSTALLASNKLPQQEHGELAAIYDRVMMRLAVQPVRGSDNLRALLDTDVDPDPKPLLTWAQVTAAQAEVRAIALTDAAKDALITVHNALDRAGLRPTNRRIRECQRIVRARAWLEDADKAEPEHLVDLADVFWGDPAQIPTVEKAVLSEVDAGYKDALTILDTVATVVSDITEMLDTAGADRSERAVQAKNKAVRAAKEVRKVQRNARGRAVAKLADAWGRLETLYERVMVEGLEIPAAVAPTLEESL